ncbi:putative WD repeat-containing protein [Actinoplanes sp. SE50]|uniref:AAA family ATPase n=1 Tax=unclassified Actinoplanes TaxID=2626549 RepID=UPI00023ED137|nr:MULTISPECIES: AAA family ATPase [unclassified Actinoplanes]AEV87798.1 putative WD repeat-containing protein [Actinoplanes sp. SE50/110]ATO86200.1 putative WD repeat-containing protein [Actinoplanes sp. SE50]SLM03614.1 hypothetical protein ACSP50_6907 [Actinoplanes sp. SE50/110]
MPDPDDTPGPVERARAGVRSWVRESGRRGRARLRSAGPYAILAFLTASAVAPVAGAGLGVPGAFAMALAQLGGLGSNYLADVLAGTAQRMRGGGPITEQQWRDAVADELLPLLTAGDERGGRLQAEVSAVLHEIDAVATALTEAATADDGFRHQLEAVFEELGSDVGSLRWMLTDVRRSLDDLRQQFAGQTLLLHRQLEQVRRQLLAVNQETAPAAPPLSGSVPPYPGLASFQPADAPWFRGRETQVAELLARLSEQLVGGPPLVVTGVSGVGKSSLVRAGLLPAIGAGRLGPAATAWPWIVLTPGATPLRDLVRHLAGLPGATPEQAGDPAADVDGLLRDVRREPASLGALAGRAAAGGRRPVIVVDQFEELFTQCADPAERLAFAAALTAAAPALVMIAVRSDFYPACVELPPLARLLAGGHVVLGPLDAGSLRRAVVEPAEQAGLKVDPGLPELMLRDLGEGGAGAGGYEPGALPLLAHALRATWERRDGDQLTVEAYRATGGIRHAVAETAERIYLGLGPEEQAALRAALLSLVTMTGTGTVVRRRGRRSPDGSRVLDRLVAERLVTAGTDTVEISHEALLTGWPRLAGWVAEARSDLELRQRVAEAAEDWDRSGRDPDLLLRGARLLAARERLIDADSLPGPAPDFLAAGAEAAERAEAARRRATGRLRRLAAGLGVALLLAVAGGLVALDRQHVAATRQREAQASQQEAASRQYAAEAVNALNRDEIAAVRRALDSWQVRETTEARGAVLSAQMVNAIGTLGTDPGGTAAAFSPDGRRIAIGHGDGSVRLWDATTLTPVGQRMVPPNRSTRSYTRSLAFSPDGRFLLAGVAARNGLYIWDAATGDLVRALPGGAGAAWLPGTSTAMGWRTDTKEGMPFELGMWDAASGRLIRSLPVGDYAAYDLAISADGRYVAVTRPVPSPAKVWRISDGRLVTTVPDTAYVAFAPDGTLIGANRLGQLTQWAIPSGRRRQTMITESVTPFAAPIRVTPDGVVVVNNGLHSVALFALAGGDRRTEDTGVASLPSPAVSPDGRTIAVTGVDAPTAVFRRATTWLPHGTRVITSAFAPDGRRLATAGEDGKVRVWDPGSRALLTEIPTDGVPISVAFPDPGTLVDSTTNGRLEVRDAATGKVRVTVPLPGTPADLAVSPDRSLIAVVTQQSQEDLTKRGVTGQADQALVYDVGRQAVRARFPLGATPSSVAFSRDGTSLFTGLTVAGGYHDGYALQRWRTADFSPAGSVPLGYRPLDIAVSPVDGAVAVTGTNGSVEVREPDGAPVRWQTPPQIQQVDAIAFAPDGRTLASTEFDGRVHLWDVGARSLTATLNGHDYRSGALAFAPDGSLLASSGFDHTFGVWRLDPVAVLPDLCRVARIASRNDGKPLSPLCGN